MAKIESKNKQNPQTATVRAERRTCEPLSGILSRPLRNSRAWRGRQPSFLLIGGYGRQTQVSDQAYPQAREPQPLHLAAPTQHAGACAKPQHPRTRRENKIWAWAGVPWRPWGLSAQKGASAWNGANIKTVADLMGHSSITMTEKYRHVVDSLKQDAIHSLGSISYAMPWFTPWHSWHFGTLWWTLQPTSEGSYFSSVILFGFWFGSAGVHICEI